MLTTTLWWNIYNRTFQQLQQTLLNTFTTNITSYRRIVSLTGNLINLINKDNASFGFSHIIISNLQQTCQQAFNVFAYITGFRQYRSINNRKRHFQQFGNRTSQQRLSSTSATYHDDIGFFNLHIILSWLLQQTFVVVIHGNRQITLGIVLANHILVKELFNLNRLRKFLQIQRTGIRRPLHRLLHNFVCLLRTTVTDIATHPCNEKANLTFRSSTEATTSFIFRIFSQCTFLIS